MKKNFSLLCSLLWLFSAAQLDTDHWFAPMSSQAGTNSLESYIYLSTNETTPFTVQIYNNNVLYTTSTVSKGNPATVTIPGSFMVADSPFQLFTPSNKGLYLKGSKKFYANYRFGISNHAEIITSKGLAGLGTTFYAAMAPITYAVNYVSSTIGVIATEDNTTVTFSGYNPGVVFSDGSSSPTKTTTLNKGQSYILDAISTDSPNNLSGLVGTKIVSNKPISVTNGNFNAIYTTFNSSNNDILMDQSVPIQRLGKDFAVVKGNGPATSGMEAALVVATEDNTQLIVNGNNYGAPLNAGQHAMIQGTNYINQGNNHYNISIKSNKNIYVYQLLAGTSSGNVYASGGFNYIPPLSCFMPNTVDEIGSINQLGNSFYDTRLNIITQTGATVTLNGNPIAAANGPYPITGNPQWVTYSIANVSGNATINSTKSVTAGIAAGSGAVGYGGYFAGFSSVPVIVKTGNCYAGIKLQVDNTYDAYQWYLNGNPISGATNYFINPELYGAGTYTVSVTKNNCETRLTEPYIYTPCPPITTINYNIGSCQNLVISPTFTNSTQSIDPSQTVILGPPINGTATVNPANGQITYIPNANLTADTLDEFVYYIQGTGNPSAFEYIKAKINIDVLQTANASITGCAGANSNALFDLTSVSLSPDTGTTTAYYSNSTLTSQITNPTSYSSSAGVVYALVTSSFGCTKPAQIALSINPSPNINTTNFNGSICDDNLDGTVSVDFSTVTPQIVNNSASFNVRYYLSQADANAGNNNTIANNWSYNTATTVFVRVDPITGTCPPAFGQLNFSIGNKIPLLTQNFATTVCDPDGNGSEVVNLNNYKNNFTTDPVVSLTFYNSLADAQNSTAAINASQTVAGTGTYYIRFISSNGCPTVASITITLNVINTNNASLSSCANTSGLGTFNLTSAVVSTTPGVSLLYYSDAALTTPIPNPTSYQSPGSIAYVKVSTSNGCYSTAQITLTVYPLPNINTSTFNGAICDDNLDGIIPINFSTVTPQIVNNSAAFNVRYYLSQADALAGNNNNLPNNWTYNTTTVVYIRVDSINGNCTSAFGQITLSIGNKVTLLTQNATDSVCDNDLNGSESVNLLNYKSLFSVDPNVSLSFFATLADAQNNTAPIGNTQNIAGVQIFYIRFISGTACPNTGKLTLNLKGPKKCNTLTEKTICPNGSTTLDAGAGFSSYLWSTGATTQTITAGVGSYYVDLGFNGCVYRQQVTIFAAQEPVIKNIQVNGSSITITAIGGTPPYEYSLDGVNWQSSNVFQGLIRGVHTAFVRGADRCSPVSKDFLIIGLTNAITPNGDGINDVWDLSELKLKNNVNIEIYDRYNALVFRAKKGQYVWDGKLRGNALNTDSYWYKITWDEPETKLPVVYTGWIMLKNRD